MDGNSSRRHEGPDIFRTGKAYTITEAARLTGTSYQNVRRWLLGYESPGHPMQPVFGPKTRTDEAPMVSFLELVEIAVAREFRREGVEKRAVPLERVRRAHAHARAHLGLPYPLASLKLRQEGGHILHDFVEPQPGEGTLVLSLGGQWVLPKGVQAELEDIEYGDEWASEWFPFGRHVPIVVNPRIAAGSPTIYGTAVAVHTIRQRFEAGERIDYLVQDYDIRPSDVEEALRHTAA